MFCDKCCTTISLGRPRQRCPATTSPPMMCPTASASHTGHGTASRSNTRRLSTARNLSRCHPQKTFEPVRQMTLVGVANGSRDVSDGDTAKQQLACALDSYVLQVRVRRE